MVLALTGTDISIAAASVRISAIPENLKQLALLGFDNQLAQAKEKAPENETPAMKAVRLQTIDFLANHIKAIVNDGDHFSFKVGLNQKKDDITADLHFTVNTPPIADAGPDQTVGEGTKVTFDGSHSSDTEAPLFDYYWTLPDGTTPLLDAVAAMLRSPRASSVVACRCGSWRWAARTCTPSASSAWRSKNFFIFDQGV